MGLVSMTLMLRNARESGYAVGAFNILDYNSTLAVVRAAEQLDAPVIVQTSAKTVKHWTHATIVSWLRHIAEDSPVPVALHLVCLCFLFGLWPSVWPRSWWPCGFVALWC